VIPRRIGLVFALAFAVFASVALAPTAAAAAHKMRAGSLKVTVKGALPRGGRARLELLRVRGTGLARVARVSLRRRSVTFAALRPGPYFARVRAPGRIGDFNRVVVKRGRARLALRLTALAYDSARAVSGTFAPGHSLVLTATDATGVKYSLNIPPDALARPVKISIRPYRRPIVSGKPIGTGVDISPSGLRLAHPAALTISGLRDPHAGLVTYDSAGARWRPVTQDGQYKGATTAELDHFSGYEETDWEGRVTAEWEFNLFTDGLRDKMAMFAFLALTGDIPTSLDVNTLPKELRKDLEKLQAKVLDYAKLASSTACDNGPSKSDYYLAAISARFAVMLGALHDPQELVQAAAARCAPQFLTEGNQRCRNAEKAQDGPARANAKTFFLWFGVGLARNFVPSLIDEALGDALACTGYSVDITSFTDTYSSPSSSGSGPVPPGSLKFHAVTCSSDVVGATWTGIYTHGNGQQEVMVFDVPQSGGEFEMLTPQVSGHTTVQYTGSAVVPDTMTVRIVATTPYDPHNPDTTPGSDTVEGTGDIHPGITPDDPCAKPDIPPILSAGETPMPPTV
jgi:hypothetical protein